MIRAANNRPQIKEEANIWVIVHFSIIARKITKGTEK